MKLKICGLKYPENISKVIALKPDFIGFIFYPASKRYAGESLQPEFTWSIPADIKKAGVFVNEPILSVLEHVARYNLDLVQLHGNETAAYCEDISKLVPVIKAFQVNEQFDFSILNEYKQHCSYFLFDSASEGFGGSGKKFDHQLLSKYKLNIPYFISGGIDKEDIPGLEQSPAYAIDINSKFETEPGVKDIDKLRSTIDEVRLTITINPTKN